MHLSSSEPVNGFSRATASPTEPSIPWGTEITPSILGKSQIWAELEELSTENKKRLALEIFYLVLRDVGLGHNDPSGPDYGSYTNGLKAIAALFPGNQ